MAKKYLDIFLSSQKQLNIDKLLLISLTCLRIAAKFNQTYHQTLFSSTQYCIQISGGKFTQQQFLDCEIEIISHLNFNLRFTTPYDYLVVKNLLPPEKKILALLESVIDFSITMIQMRNSSAQEIFFGCLLYCCQEKQASQICYSIIQATTFKWSEAQQVAKSLDKKLRQLLQQ